MTYKESEDKLNNLIDKGILYDTLSVADVLSSVDMQLVANKLKLFSAANISPHLTYQQIMASINAFGGNVEKIDASVNMTRDGVRSLILHLNSPHLTLDEVLYVHQISKFGDANLLASRKSNVLLLTTEEGSPDRRVNTYIKEENIEQTEKWLGNRGVTIAHTTITSLYHLNGSNIWVKTVALVIKQN